MSGGSKFSLDDIRELIEGFKDCRIGIDDFCATFERVWNFEFDKGEINAAAYKALDSLFDEVVLFCPFPRVQWEYPKYRDEGEIRVAAAKALALLD